MGPKTCTTTDCTDIDCRVRAILNHVEQLEWGEDIVKSIPLEGGGYLRETPRWIARTSDDFIFIIDPEKGRFRVWNTDWRGGTHDTLDAAKAVAQKVYEDWTRGDE
jgi:hypothetical protein